MKLEEIRARMEEVYSDFPVGEACEFVDKFYDRLIEAFTGRYKRKEKVIEE